MSVTRIRMLGVLIGALCVSVSAVRAQTDAAPSTDVREIVVRSVGSAPIDEAFVRAQIGARTGETLSRMVVSRDVRALLDTGRFADVTAEIEPLEDGLRLVYAVTGRLRLAGPLRVRGAKHFREDRIRDWMNLDAGDLVDDAVVGARARRVKEEYRKELFPDVDVTWVIEPEEENPSRAVVTVTVDEGGRRRVKAGRFEGNTALPNGTLRRAYGIPSRWNPLRWIVPKRYDPDEIAAGRFLVEEFYRNKGYLDVRVSEPEVESDPRGRAVIAVSIDEGPLYRCGSIDLDGVTLFPEDEVRRGLALHEGDVAGGDKIGESTQAVRDYYGCRGYINTAVRPILDADAETGIVNMRLAVTEGALVRMRNIRIRGNTRTRDKVIRRELLVVPGETFDEVRVRRSENRVMNLGFFERVNHYNESTPVPDEKDLVFEVVEKRTGQFMLGAGFSSIDKFVGFVEVSQGNFDLKNWPTFTGGGQKLKLHAEFGSTRSDYGVSFVEPWFLDRKLSLGADLYRRDYSYSDYDVLRAGGAVSLGKSLPYACRIDFRYRLERAELKDLEDNDAYVDVVSGNPVLFEPEDAVKSAFRVALTHDTRNNPFIPTRGMRATLSGELMGGLFGFDTDLVDLELRAQQYVPLWFGHVLSLEGRCEFVDAFDGTDEVPISDRLFIGGGRTLRGFEYRDVGPKAQVADAAPGDTSYRPYGGQSLAMASAEYLVSIVPHVRLAGFFDIGNVWSDTFDIDTGNLASSAGVGLRLDLPGFPIRVDRAWVLDKDNEITDEDPWVIWIGYD